MKKIALFSCLLLVTLFVSAQTHQLRWLPVETWATDSAFKSVVSLEDGNYERSSTLPSSRLTTDLKALSVAHVSTGNQRNW